MDFNPVTPFRYCAVTASAELPRASMSPAVNENSRYTQLVGIREVGCDGSRQDVYAAGAQEPAVGVSVLAIVLASVSAQPLVQALSQFRPEARLGSSSDLVWRGPLWPALAHSHGRSPQ